jgi:FkbM family methyltransferase
MKIPPKHFIVVGAGETLEFLDLAETDPTVIVWAFEANPHVVSSVLSTRRLPPNYHLLAMAASDFSGRSTFNVCTNAPCSSLREWGNGPRFGEMTRVDVAVTRLDEFMDREGIKEVEYLHIDAQGSDLDVIRGLGDSLRRVRAGQCESLAPGVIRGHLWEMAKQICPDKEWACILHPDEFPTINPLELLGHVSTTYPDLDAIMIKNVHYFPHISQAGCWSWTPGNPIEPEMRWCMWPGHDEFRYVKFDLTASYDATHGAVIPRRVYRTFFPDAEGFHHKHFTFRSVDQVRRRAVSRVVSGWQTQMYDGLIDADTIFFQDLGHLFSGSDAKKMR